MPIYLNGLLLGLSLIMALGPQNIFLIRQGAKRNHAVLSAVTCFLCDLILITASVIGLKDILESHANLRVGMTWFGSAFLLYYGISALKKAFAKTKSEAVEEKQNATRWQIIALALGFSLLNPHAVIDSLVLIGGGSGQFPGHEKIFLLGVLSSSFIWFAALTFTAYYFSNVLVRDKVWRRVEFFSGILMLFLSLKLAISQL
jgi:L-lysine exporter family protein LysE/ArgO